MNAAVLEFQREPAHLPSAVLAISVHILLFVILVFGVSWQSHAPDAVNVELWNLAPPQKIESPPPQVRRKPEPVAEVKPVPKPVAKLEVKPAPAPKKVDIAVEKIRKPAVKPPPVRLDLAKQMKDQLARELDEVRQERERSEVLAQFKPAATPKAAQIDPSYGNRIRAKIKPLINVPSDITGNPEAIYDVEQLPTGEIISAKLRKSSGNRAYDDAVERAILRASPLPRPDRVDQFQRRLELRFRPNDR